MHPSLRILGLAGLLLAAIPPARAELPAIACPELLDWTKRIEAHATADVTLGPARVPRRQETLPGIFLAPITTETFGKPALDWTDAEVQQLARMLSGCARQRDYAEHRDALMAARQQTMRQARPFLQRRTRALVGMPQDLEAIALQPPSPQILAFLGALPEAAEPAGALAVQQAMRRLPAAVRRHGQTLVQAVPDLLPEDRRSHLQPLIDRHLATARAQARAGLEADIAAVPDDPGGLARLQQWARQPMMALLGAEDRAALEAATASRRAAILAAIEADLLARVADVPEDAEGFDRLRQIARNSRRDSLAPDRVAALDAAIAARAGPLASLAAEKGLADLAALPQSMPSIPRALRQRDAVAEALRQFGGAELVARFEAEAQATLAALADAVFPEFEQRLAELPETQRTVDNLANPPPWLAGLPGEAASGGGRYHAAIAARRQAVIAAMAAAEAAEQARIEAERVAREKAKAAEVAREAGPLAGRHYRAVDESMVLEFLDSARVLVTDTRRDLTIAGTYEEIAGDRLIVTLPDRNFVLRRDGVRLDGGQLVLERVAAP